MESTSQKRASVLVLNYDSRDSGIKIYKYGKYKFSFHRCSTDAIDINFTLPGTEHYNKNNNNYLLMNPQNSKKPSMVWYGYFLESPICMTIQVHTMYSIAKAILGTSQ